MAVALAELDRRNQCHRRVAVFQGVVLDLVGAQHGVLDREVWVEVLAAECRQRCVQRRIRQVEVRLRGDALGRDLEYRLGDEEEVGQLGRADRSRPRLRARIWCHRFKRSKAHAFCRMAPARRR